MQYINTYKIKLQDIFETTQNKIANPFLSTSDYRNALRGITRTQTELKQLSLAVDQLRHIIQNQPTPIPLKYGEKEQEQNKHQPQTKEELKELVEDESIHLGNIDTSEIADMSGLFQNSKRTNFSGIESWDVSSVENMSQMFNNANSFNQPLNSWDVGNVVNMENMFSNAASFN